MRFSNILSYGENNVIDFDKSRVVQLVGTNGAGKSSIATILEEVLFNKNSRDISKADLYNWNNDNKHYHIELDFSKGSDNYTVIKDVKSTAKVSLLMNGEDISGHTATQTYKLISDIFDCDFKTFTKMVYQSVGSSLDFLKTTDTKRKEFLVSFFDQSIYKETEEKVKADIKELKNKASFIEGKLSVAEATLLRANKDINNNIPDKLPLVECDLSNDYDEISSIKEEAALVINNLTMISQKRELDKKVQAAKSLVTEFNINNPINNMYMDMDYYNEVVKTRNNLKAHINSKQSSLKEFTRSAANDKCSLCGSHIDVSVAVTSRDKLKHELELLDNELKETEAKFVELNSKLKVSRERESLVSEYNSAVDRLSSYSHVVDNGEELNVATINNNVKLKVSEIQKRINEITAEQKHVQQHNSKVDTLVELNNKAKILIKESQNAVNSSKKELKEITDMLNDLEVIAKSLKDIVGYKLEYQIKAFEDLINVYLTKLTEGQFALGFKLEGVKLNVIIFNNGREIKITSCSTGQQQRIQTATLLAMRSLLGSINKVDINLNFLDEVISYIDTDGIETLIEVLLEEDQLNSFIVSHGHSHPMAKQIKIVQDDKQVSRLEKEL